MSQSSRLHASRPSRLREKLARELAWKWEISFSTMNSIATADVDGVHTEFCVDSATGVRVFSARSVRSLRSLGPGGVELRRLGFDVHAAREHATALIALEAEQSAFEGWTRAQGLGPENREPGAFAPTAEHVAMRIARGQTRGLSKLAPFHRRGGWPGNLARQWGGDSRAPMGRSLARLGQHILTALEGQPSECGRCDGKPHTVISDITRIALGRFATREGAEHAYRLGLEGDPLYSLSFLGECPDCQGTGHNLRGVLPAVEWSPQIVSKMADGLRVGTSPFGTADPWPMELYMSGGPELRRAVDRMPLPGEPPEAGPNRTRVVARGAHRERLDLPVGSISTVHLHKGKVTLRLLHPGWYRGRLKHAERA